MSDTADKPSVLFVCMGNICRSPTGEAVMKHLLKRRGLEHEIDVDSAGTIDYHSGNPADPRMCRAASARGYELTSRARQVSRDDLHHFDLIVAMDADNLADLGLLGLDGRAEVRLLGSFLDGYDPDAVADVPDPYHGGPAGFETVIDMIESACENILDHLLARKPPR